MKIRDFKKNNTPSVFWLFFALLLFQNCASKKPLTDIFVSLPAGYTSANSEVFMKYSGEAASAYIPANATLKQFTTSGAYYKVVQGRAAKLLALCKKDGKFYFATVTIASITANHAETIATMTETTEANFKTQITSF